MKYTSFFVLSWTIFVYIFLYKEFICQNTFIGFCMFLWVIMLSISIGEIKEKLVEAIALAETSIPPDVEKVIRSAYETEKSEVGKAQLRAILENIEVARKNRLPICQDTGLLGFIVEIGDDFPIKPSKIKEIIIEATKEATKKVPLRPNAIDIWAEKNTGNNVGKGIPIIHFDHNAGKDLKIIVFPKGGGSSYVVKLYSIPPSKGLDGLIEVAVRAVFDAGPKPCPPTFMGIGIGGTEDLAVWLAKRALLNKMTENNENEEIANVEREIVKKVNELGIGPMGLGGRWTVFNARIEWACRHPATFLIGIVFNCWALRRAFLEVKDNNIMIYQ